MLRPVLLFMVLALAGVAQGQLEAISREVSVFNLGEPSAPIEAISREVSIFNFDQSAAQVEAISREVSLFNFGESTATTEAISREISVFNFGMASAPIEAISREVSLFNFDLPSAPIEAISREVSVLVASNLFAGNDFFANRSTLAGLSTSATNRNTMATKEFGEPNHAGNPGGHSLWWTWTAPTNGTVTLDTIGSTFDTLLAVYTGDAVTALTPVASDDESGGNHTSLLTFPAVPGTAYQIAVDGFAGPLNNFQGDAGGIVLNLHEAGGPPLIEAHPQSRILPAGTNITFSVSVSGAQPFTYQWRKNGTKVPGATSFGFVTSAALTITNLQPGDSGSYTVAVSNSYGVATGGPAYLTVFARPANDAYGETFAIYGLTNRVSGSNALATAEAFEPNFFAGHSIWWRWTAPTNGMVIADTIGSSFDTVLAVYTGFPNPILLTNDDQSGGNNTSLLSFDATAQTTYYLGVDGSAYAASAQRTGLVVLNVRMVLGPPAILAQPSSQVAGVGASVAFSVRVGGYGPLAYQWRKDGNNLAGATASSYMFTNAQTSNSGIYSVVVSNTFGATPSADAGLIVYPPPPNDAFTNRLLIAGISNTVFGTNIGASKEVGEPNHANNPGGKSVWWTWTEPTNGTVIIDTSGSSFDTLLAVYTGASVSNLSPVAASDNNGTNLSSKLAFTGVQGTAYQIAVDGKPANGYGTVALTVQQFDRLAPLILTQPQSQAGRVGGSALFTVGAYATPPPSYQWKFNDTTLTGKTSSNLTLTALTTNQAGNYTVVVSNSEGSVTSAPAALRVDKSVAVGFRGKWPDVGDGAAVEVRVTNGLAYVATTTGFVILDVSDPGNLRRVGGYTTENPAVHIAVQDGFLYLLTSSNQFGGAALSSYDARNPAQPQKLAAYPSGAATDFAFLGDSVCLLNGSTLRVLNRADFSPIGATNVARGIGSSLTVASPYLYVGWPGGIGQYDLSDPANPHETAFFGTNGTGPMATSGTDYVYAVQAPLPGFELQVFQVYDLINSRPLVGNLFDGSLGAADLAWALTAVETNLYVAVAGSTGNGLGIYDVSQPWTPAPLGSQLFGDGLPLQISVADGYAYIACSNAGVKIFDVSTVANPVATGQYFTSVQVNSTALQGNLAYVRDAYIGFHILDVSAPDNPVLLGTYRASQSPGAIAIQGRYVYLALNSPPAALSQTNGLALEVIDVADSSAPTHVFTTTIGNPRAGFGAPPQISALAIQGNLALVASFVTNATQSVAGVAVVDLSNPTSPVQTGSFDAGISKITTIDLQGRYAYLADAGSGLKVLDLIDPSNPVQATGFMELATTYSAFIRAGQCYLSGKYGTEILDVSQPTSAVHVATNSVAGALTRLPSPYVLENSTDGLTVQDLFTLTNPIIVGQFAGTYDSVAANDRYAFAAGGAAGLTILDLGASFGVPPSVSSQPQDTRGPLGGAASFFVGAGGTVPLSYQWQFNGVDIPGATDVLLNLQDVQSADAGQYSVRIVNAYGGPVVSASATLSVNNPPTIALTSPGDQQVLMPPATITVAADASDTDGFVAQVDLFAETNLVASFTSPPYVWTTNNVPSGVYHFKARATDNEGAATETALATVIVSNLNVIQFSQSNYTVHKSNALANVSILRSSGGTASVNFTTLDGNAFAVVPGIVGAYYAVSNVFNFPPDLLSTNVPIQIVNDLVNRRTRQFVVQLFSPSAGWQLAYPSNAYVTIIDDTPASNNFTDVSIPGAGSRGALQVWLQPTNAQGQWRFWWENGWHPSGAIVSNLVAGDYTLQFMPRYGFITPSDLVVTNFNTAFLAITNFYMTNGLNPRTGTLSVTLLPQEVAGATDPNYRGQWRLAGEIPTNWQDSGNALSNLAEGAHLIEFKPVSGGYQTPAQQVAFVVGDRRVVYQGEYVPLPASVPNGPVALDSYNTITNDAPTPGSPYRFCGQLWSEGGFGSGTVVKPRTVLTAAHVVFNPITLSYSSNVWWFFQRQRGEYEPLAQRARGWHVFEGYAAQRTNDLNNPNLGPNEESAEARRQDAAAIYFFEDAGRGGFAGYLITSTNNDWLASSLYKELVGYPVENVLQTNVGKMHATAPFYAALQKVTDNDKAYTTTQVISYGGNSGGPLCVLSTNSQGRPFFIPAGIYLGGSGESEVRIIDLDVVDLINRAELSAHGGTNSSAGGVISVRSPLGSTLTQTAYLYITVGPAAAVQAGGAWRISPTNFGDLWGFTNYLHTNYLLATISTNFTIEMTNIPGFNLPTNFPPVILSSGSRLEVDLVYQASGPVVLTPRLIYDRIQGLAVVAGGIATFWTPQYRIDTATQLNGTSGWSPVVTNLTTNVLIGATNWIPNTTPVRNGSRFYRAIWLP